MIVESLTTNSRADPTRMGTRLILFDVKSPIVGNNIDVVLLNTEKVRDLRKLLSSAEYHIALGELKGGIDPAGADEHWKTARSALERIRQKHSGGSPQLFFAGAAIENSMAKEIFSDLQSGKLTRAANLTNLTQTQALADWLISL